MLNDTKSVIKHKIGLLNLAEELGNVSKACRIMGLSRDTIYCYQNAAEKGGFEALVIQNRRKPNIKNRVDKKTEDAVVAYSVEQPAHGQVRASNELRKRGVFISPSGVRCVWLRHQLGHFKDQHRALEDKMAAQNLILTESQVQALEGVVSRIFRTFIWSNLFHLVDWNAKSAWVHKAPSARCSKLFPIPFL